MKIHVICTKEELEKTDEIQEALSRAMKPLTNLGFKGEITIEEAQDANKKIIDKSVSPTSVRGEAEAHKLNLSEDISPLLLSSLSCNAGFGIEYFLQREYKDTKHLLQDGVYFCAVLDLGEDYDHATYVNLGACESVRFLAKHTEPTKLKELISEARETKAELLRLIEGNFSYPEQAISLEQGRKMQRFFNKAGAPFLSLAMQHANRRRRL